MKMRVAKKILGVRQEMLAMFRAGKGWRLAAYRWEQVHAAHREILRLERRHGFPSKWS